MTREQIAPALCTAGTACFLLAAVVVFESVVAGGVLVLLGGAATLAGVAVASNTGG